MSLVPRPREESTLGRLARVADYLFFLVYAVIVLHFVLELLGAPEEGGVARAVDTLATPLIAPFRGLAPSWELFGVALDLPALLAILVWFLLHRAVVGLLGLFERGAST